MFQYQNGLDVWARESNIWLSTRTSKFAYCLNSDVASQSLILSQWVRREGQTMTTGCTNCVKMWNICHFKFDSLLLLTSAWQCKSDTRQSTTVGIEELQYMMSLEVKRVEHVQRVGNAVCLFLKMKLSHGILGHSNRELILWLSDGFSVYEEDCQFGISSELKPKARLLNDRPRSTRVCTCVYIH